MDQMAAKPTLLNKSCSNQKILADLLLKLLKLETNPGGFFDLSNFYLVKLVSQPYNWAKIAQKTI